MAYSVTLTLEGEGNTPLEAVESFMHKADRNRHFWNYTVEDEDTGRRYLVDMDRRATEDVPNPERASSFPHLAADEYTRGRLVRELQDAGWWSVADDVADGISLDTVMDRVSAVTNDEDEQGEVTDIISNAVAGGAR